MRIALRRYGQGFTVIELLIVIVVIVVLVAITSFAYTNITAQSRANSAQSAATQAASRLAVYATQQNATYYPTQLSDAGVSNAGTTSYQYSVDNNAVPPTYCVTATVSGVSYYVDSGEHNVPTAGACLGHVLGGAPATIITNLATNPSLESQMGPWTLAGSAAGSTIGLSTDWAHSGSNSVKAVMTAAVKTSGDVRYYINGTAFAPGFAPGQTYTVSAWINTPAVHTTFATDSTSRQRRILFWYTIDGTNFIPLFGPQGTNTVGPQRLTSTFTIPNNAIGMALAVGVAGSPTDTSFVTYVDDVLITSGSTVYGYGDGSSPGWSWNGTAQTSSSTGPAL